METVEGREGSLTSRQWQAMLHLLRTGNPAETAKYVGIAERTLRKWRAKPEWREAFRQAGRAASRETAARTMSVQSEAVSTLVHAMRAERAPWPVKIQAAGKLLEHARWVGDDDLERRVEELERHRQSEAVSPWSDAQLIEVVGYEDESKNSQQLPSRTSTTGTSAVEAKALESASTV